MRNLRLQVVKVLARANGALVLLLIGLSLIAGLIMTAAWLAVLMVTW